MFARSTGDNGSQSSGVVSLIVVIALLAGVGFYLLANEGADGDSEPEASPSSQDVSGSEPASPVDVDETRQSEQVPEPIAVPGAPGPPVNPLDLDLEYLNQACTGDYLLMLGTAGLDEPNPPQNKLPRVASGRADAKYLWNQQSCNAAFTQTAPKGEIFQAYLGPFGSIDEVCRARRTGASEVWVKRLGTPSVTYCVCEYDVAALPKLTVADADSNPFLVSDVQQLLHAMKRNPERNIDGNFDPALEEQLKSYQESRELPGNGALDRETWRSVIEDAC